MSDNEQSAVNEQPEEQASAENTQEEQPTGTGEDTEPSPAPESSEPLDTNEEPKEAEPQPSEDQGEPQPTGEDQAALAAEDEETPAVVVEEPVEEPEPEIKEEPVVITPDDSPFWLSTEEVLGRGLPENEVENFKNFYFRQTHSLQAWYEKLKEFVIQTEFMTLSKDEIDALSVEGEPSEEQQQVLTALEDRVNQAIELFGNDGAIVRVNGRSAKDAILDRDEEVFITEVRDAVVNELEVEKQRANAYAIWKDQDRQPSAFKRGMSNIRASFRRSRVNSGNRKTNLQEEKPKEEDKKDEEAPEAEGSTAAEGEATGGAPVTIEVQVEKGDDQEADQTEDAPKDETDVAPAEEQPKDDAAVEPVQEPASEEPPVQEAPVEEAPKDETEVTEAPKDEGDEVKEKGEGDKTEGDGEIEIVEETKAKTSSPVHHKLRKVKTDTLDNQIVRSFIKSTTALYKVTNGKGAIEQLRRSIKIRSDLNQLKAFGGIEGIQVSLGVCRWQEQLASYPGMEFRGFVYKNELNGLSQYNDTAYYPSTDVYFNTIQAKVQEFFKSNVQEALRELENYIIDFYVTPDKVLVVRLNPFYTAIGACLFTWNENGKVLTQGPFQFKIIEVPMTAPEAFTSFQPFWQSMLDSVLLQRRPQRQPKTCILL